MVAEKPPSVDKITPTGNDDDDSNNDQDSSNEDSEQENESKEQVSNSEQEEESKDDDQEEEEFVHTPSSTDDKDDDNLESEIDDVNKSDEESDDVIKGDKEIVQSGDIPHTDAEIVSPLDVHVHYEVPRTQAPTLLTIPISVITESSPVYTNIPQSSQTFTPPPILTTPIPLPSIETINPLSTLLDFASVFRFNDRITTLENEVAKLKKDPLHTQVTTLVDGHLDIRLGETKEEFMNFLSESLMARIKEQVKDQLPQILPKEVSNFVPPVIEALILQKLDTSFAESMLLPKKLINASITDSERKFMNSSMVSPNLMSRCSSTKFTDAKSRSVDRGFVVSINGNGMGVVSIGGGVKKSGCLSSWDFIVDMNIQWRNNFCISMRNI
ncbi:hypothetical protein Tco_0792494 [Tanacetum coccineum]